MSSKFAPFLIAAVVFSLMSTGCSSTPTARVSLPPPSACLQPCLMPDAPPLGLQADRDAWEHTTLERFGECYALHEACATESLRRLKE